MDPREAIKKKIDDWEDVEATDVLNIANQYKKDFAKDAKSEFHSYESLEKLIDLHRDFIDGMVLPSQQISEAKNAIQGAVKKFNDIIKSIDALKAIRELHLKRTNTQIAKEPSESEKLKIYAAEIIALTYTVPEAPRYLDFGSKKAAIEDHNRKIQERADAIMDAIKNYELPKDEERNVFKIIRAAASKQTIEEDDLRRSKRATNRAEVDAVLAAFTRNQKSVDGLLSEIKKEAGKENADPHLIFEMQEKLREFEEKRYKNLHELLTEALAKAEYSLERQQRISEISKAALDHIKKQRAEGLKIARVSDDKTRKLKAEVKTEIKANAIPPSFETPPKPLTREVPAVPVQAIPAQPAPIASPAHAPRVETKDEVVKASQEVEVKTKPDTIPPLFVPPPMPPTPKTPAAPVQAIPAQPAPIASPAHAPRVETKDEVVKAPQEVEVKTKTDTISPLFVPSPMQLTPKAPAASVQDTPAQPAPIASPPTPRLETKEEKEEAVIAAPQSQVTSEVKHQPTSSSSTPYSSHEEKQFFRMTQKDVSTLPDIKGVKWTISDIKDDMEKKYRTITNGENSFFAYPDRLTTNVENVDTYLAMIEAYRKIYPDKMDSMVITPKSQEQVSKWQEACKLAKVPVERIGPPAPPVTSTLTPDAPAPAPASPAP